jgi:hypothetical protein
VTRPARRRARESLTFPGLGARIQQRLAELGTTRARFISDHAYPQPSFYFWCNDERTPRDFETILRLARDLDVTVCWLLLGPTGEREVIDRHHAATNGHGRRRKQF